MASVKRGLGRGLSALIPDEEMDALSDVTREVKSVPAVSKPSGHKSPSVALKKVAEVASIPEEAAARKKPAIKEAANAHPDAAQMKSTPSLSDHSPSRAKQTALLDEEALGAPSSLPTDAIVANPFQPRRTFDEQELTELSASISLHGILQPVLVRPDPSGESDKYQLVAGERRWRAAQRAGLKDIPVIVRPMADQQALELALIENVQRHDISAMDAAMAYRRLSDEFSLSQEQVSRRVGKSRSAVANTMRLLDLPEEARKAIESGDISEGHGRALLIATGEGSRRALLRRVLRDKLSVRKVESLARSFAGETSFEGASTKKKALSEKDREAWKQAEKECTRRLGVQVKIKVSKRRNDIVIECGVVDELQRVLALIGSNL